MSFRGHVPAQASKAKNPTRVLRRLAPYLRPYRGRLVVLGLFLIVGTLVGLVGPYLISVAVDQFIDPSDAALPMWLRLIVPEGTTRIGGLATVMSLLTGSYVVAWAVNLGPLVDLVGPHLISVAVGHFIDPSSAPLPAWLQLVLGQDVTRITGLAIVMSLLTGSYVLSWAMNVVQFRMLVRISQKVLLTMRSQIFAQIQTLSLRFFDAQEAGDLISRLANDTEVINQMFGPGLMRILRMALTLLGIIISMLALNWRLTLASYAVLPIFIAFTVILSRRARNAFRETRETIGKVSAELQENIAGVRDVQAFSRESETMQEFQSANARNRRANVQAQTLMAAFGPLLEVLSTAAIAIVVGYGSYLYLGFQPPLVSIGIIVAFLTYVKRFYRPIRELANLYAQLQAAVAGAERIFDLLDREPEIVDAPSALEIFPLEGRIAFDRVSFNYVPDEPVLRGVSFEAKQGQMVAIVGPTGAGKTTIVNLLMRFYDVDDGAVRVDGHDLRDVKVKCLREQIAMVPQDTFLFSGSVMDNIRYGRPEATEQEVIEAAKSANAHTFIERLPEGYDTPVGERGTTLSQGYRQLLAIARAILKDPRILILDEATSSVDTRTELMIQRALGELLEGRTSIVIAHRLSTIRNADQVLVIEEGEIVEWGTHQSLLAAGGVYHDLYMSQFRRQEEMQPTPLVSEGAKA